MPAEPASEVAIPVNGEVVALRLSDGRYLVPRVRVARSHLSRFLGLMGRGSLEPEEGLWLYPCRSIHMFFMRTAIDLVFLDRQQRVVRTVSRMRPWSLRPVTVTLLPVAGACSTLELAPGTLERLAVGEGEQLSQELAGATGANLEALAGVPAAANPSPGE